ncbi:hypothetical protein P691DRAFT_713513 [Macrolepiota fuliginosa MF-IS2]|uniref:Uncharacterized protein n=1 Tax=Macrolepiota fuliginosa MF-IS2 TaxID=1400762 RepID=A0A9P5X4J7_9AGAR|nr:hypothetical protein P691DRAFT_713513 [Macrolepiota fuliginosa MF-IS2]
MIGIIAAAQERKEDVEIYLTNVMSPSVTQKLAELFLKDPETVIPYVEVNLLPQGAHSGAVGIYNTDKDDRIWVSHVGRDFRSSYPFQLRRDNKTLDKVLKDTSELKFEPYTKKLKPNPGGGPTLSGGTGTTGSGVPGRSTDLTGGTTGSISGLTAGSGPDVGIPATGLFTSFAVETPATQSASISTDAPTPTPTLIPIPTLPRASPNSNTVSAKLVGTSTPLSHQQLALHQPYTTRTLTGFDDLLQYLVSANEFTNQDSQNLKNEIVTLDGLKFGAFVALFMGVERSEQLLAAVPSDFIDSPLYLDAKSSPVDWRIKPENILAKVIDPSQLGFTGRQGIYSLSFDLPARAIPLVWRIPFDQRAFAVPYRIDWDGSMSILVIWPHYATGITSAQFRGELVTPTRKYNVVCHIFLVSDQPTSYTVRFADEQYNTENYKMSLADLTRIFDTNIEYKSAFERLILPGLDYLLKELEVDSGLDNAGFTLHKIFSKLIVKQLSAELKLTDIPAWKPFDLPFSIALTGLQVLSEDAYSRDDLKVLARLSGAIHTSNDTDINLPVQFTVQYTPQQFNLYELAILPGLGDKISIGRILDVVGLSDALDLSQTFPGLSNLSNSLSISHVVVGWTSSIKPEYFRFTILLDDWTLAENIFEVTQVSVDIEVGNLSSKDSKLFVLNGWGLVKIADIDVEVFIAYNHLGSADTPDQIYFQVGTQQRAIPLGKILLHLLGDGASILPESLSSVLEETVMDDFIVQATRASGKWSVSRIQISMSIRGKIDVLDALEINEPNLIISVANPFDKDTRGVYVALNAQLIIDDIICQAQLVVASAKDSIISMIFDAGQNPVTIENMLARFLPSVDFVKLPPSLSFLTGIGIERASLTLEIVNGKFSMTEIIICASSTAPLPLWQEISLERVTLFVAHTKEGNKVEFGAMLRLSKDMDFLTFTLTYDGPTSTPSGSADMGTVTSASASGAKWSATARYEGELSVLDTLSSMSGINLRDDVLGYVDLPVFEKILDIYITKLEVILFHSSEMSSFSFDAILDWLCFSHLRFVCSKTNVWAYSFGFAIGSKDQNLIDDIPAIGHILGSQIALEHLSVVVFNYKLDVGALDPLLVKLPEMHGSGSPSLAIACRFVFQDKMKCLGESVGISTLDIIGVLSTSSVSFLVAIDKPATLFDGRLILSGALKLECKQQDKWLPSIGILGSAILDFGSHISKNPIKTDLWLFVDTANGGLGFDFRLDKWHGVFGFDGLNFDNVRFAAVFPPETFPVPSRFAIAGKVSLKINNGDIEGSVDINVTVRDLTNSYASGSIKGFTLSNLIKSLTTAVDDIPEYLEAGFDEPLEFRVVPKDMFDSEGRPLKQQFWMKGSLKLPFIHFRANIAIDITPKSISIDGHIKKVVVFHEKLFSILPSSKETVPPESDDGASLVVHVNDGSPFQAKVTGKVTFLGIEKDWDFELSAKGLEFFLAQDVWTNKGYLDGSIDDKHLAIAAGYKFELTLIKPNFSIGEFGFETTPIIGFGAEFSTNVDWENIKWELSISGSFTLFTLEVKKSFTFGLDFRDLVSIGKDIAERIGGALAADFLQALKDILSSLKDVVRVLKQAGLAMAQILKFLIHELGVAFEAAAQAVKEFFGAAWDEIVKLLHGLGYVAKQIADGLKKIGIAAFEIATAIGREFGEAVRELCSTILREGGALVSEIANFFRNVFHDPGQAIVDLLISWGRGILSIFTSVGKVLAAPFKAVFDWIFGSRPKKTREQVQEELLLILMVRMNDLLDEPVDIQTEADLEIIMRRCAIQRFHENFGYTFNGASTDPPSENPQTVTTSEAKCSYTDGNSSHMNEYYNRIMSGFKFESWPKLIGDKAAADLDKELKLLAGVVPSTYWNVSVLKRAYYPSDPEQNPVQLNGIVLFINGTHSFDGHNVTNTQSYYIGVYYEVPPPTKVARMRLGQEAFSKVPDANPPPVTDEDSLGTALTAYARKQFLAQFGFDYEQRPPDSPGSQVPPLFCKTFNALSYFEDQNTKDIEPYLTTKIFSMVSLPDWVQAKALTNMTSDYRQIVSGNEKGNWRSVKVDQPYSRDGEAFNPVNCKGMIMFYTDSRTTDQEITVSIAWIFFLGIYYEAPNHAALVRRDLLKKLCDNLAAIMEKPDLSPDTQRDKTLLAILLDRYGRDEFYSRFGYELMDQATSPETRIPETPFCTVQQTGEFENWNDKKITDWVDTIITVNDFPPVQTHPKIRQDLFDSIKRKLDRNNDWGLNKWNVTDYPQQLYPYGDSGDLIRVEGKFIHNNGTLEVGEDTVNISFVHFTGVCYIEPNPWG